MTDSAENKKNGLRNRIFRPMAILIGILSLLSACIGSFLNLKTEGEKRDINLLNTARMAAEMQASDTAGEDREVDRMNRLAASLKGVDVISVVNEDGIRVFHTNNELIGTEYDGVIPDFSARGSNGYVENGSGPSGQQRRAYAPVYDKDGEYKGFVLAIELMKNIRTEVINTLIVYGIILAVIMLIAMHLSSGVSNKIKDTLMGFLGGHSSRPLTGEEIGSRIGLSGVTVRRYMNYLVSIGKAKGEMDYETGGRPCIKYSVI